MLVSVNSLLRGDPVFVSFGAGSFFSVPTILPSIMDKKLSSPRLVALVEYGVLLHPIPEGLLVYGNPNYQFHTNLLSTMDMNVSSLLLLLYLSTTGLGSFSVLAGTIPGW